MSSANFTSELPRCNDFRSAAVTVYAAGPVPDPSMTLRAGFKGGQTGQLPRASTTSGASTKQ